MERNFRKFVLLSIVFVMLTGTVARARVVIDNTIYTAPAGTNTDPESGAPWTEAAGGQVTLAVGETISVGLANVAVEENKKNSYDFLYRR